MPRPRLQRIPKICEVCGKAFEMLPSQAQQRLCSRDCAAALTKLPPTERTCPICGVTFRVRGPAVVKEYCSWKCGGLARRQSVKLVCAQCGKPIERKPNRVKEVNFCSRGCAIRHRAIVAPRPTVRVEVPCAGCGIPLSIRPTQRKEANYCSRGCATRTRSREADGIEHALACQKCPTCATTRETRVPVDRQISRPWFCSEACRLEVTHPTYICPTCGKSFRRYRSRVLWGPPYCSTACRNTARPGGRDRFYGWSEAQLAFLQEHYDTAGPSLLAEAIGKRMTTIHAMAKSLGLGMTTQTRNASLARLATRGSAHPSYGRPSPPKSEAGRQAISASKTGDRNPMRRAEVVAKVKRYWQEHPEQKRELTHKRLLASQPYRKSGQTKPERLCRQLLQDLMVPHLYQRVIKPNFVVDFYLPEHTPRGTILEVAGEWWHAHPRYAPLSERQQSQIKRDYARQAYLTRVGYSVVWIWAEHVSRELLRAVLSALSGHPDALDAYAEALMLPPVLSGVFGSQHAD